MAQPQQPTLPPPDGQDPQGQPGGGDDKDPQQLIEDAYTDLQKIQQLVAQAAPSLADKFKAVIEGFQMVIETMVKGQGGPGGGASDRGPTVGGPGSVPM